MKPTWKDYCIPPMVILLLIAIIVPNIVRVSRNKRQSLPPAQFVTVEHDNHTWIVLKKYPNDRSESAAFIHHPDCLCRIPVDPDFEQQVQDFFRTNRP